MLHFIVSKRVRRGTATHDQSHLSSFIFLQTSVVCPVFESIKVVAGRQRQVTVLAFSCSTTTQCWTISAVEGGIWLRMGAGVGATGGFFAAQPVRNRPTKRQTFLIPLFSLSPDRLSMAILVTRPKGGSKRAETNACLNLAGRGRLVACGIAEPGGDLRSVAADRLDALASVSGDRVEGRCHAVDNDVK